MFNSLVDAMVSELNGPRELFCLDIVFNKETESGEAFEWLDQIFPIPNAKQ